MTENWTIKVGRQTYGPYTTDVMHQLQAEGRLAPYSLVAPEGEQIFRPAHDFPELAPLFGESGKHTPQEETSQIRYVIISDMKSRAITGVEREIEKLGTYYPLNSQSWVLVCGMELNALRNKLMQELGNPDHLFIVDVTHNKAVWCNYGPESESGIRQTWLKG